MERLVLWDIDQTLVTYAGFGARMFAHALRATTGRELEHVPDMAGKTDRELITTIFGLHGLPIDASIYEAFYLEVTVASREHAAEMRAIGRALPGSSAALTALSSIPGIVQSVVTGNIAVVAQQKLSLLDLAEPIDFEVGGYGSDSSYRTDLVDLARNRAVQKYGRLVPGEHVVVIGDTPHDIVGARTSGVIAIGVASGRSTPEELKEAGAHVVLPSLVDTAALLAAIVNS